LKSNNNEQPTTLASTGCDRQRVLVPGFVSALRGSPAEWPGRLTFHPQQEVIQMNDQHKPLAGRIVIPAGAFAMLPSEPPTMAGKLGAIAAPKRADRRPGYAQADAWHPKANVLPTRC
jgi:hypothetical protein